jgi:hypothetical protein
MPPNQDLLARLRPAWAYRTRHTVLLVALVLHLLAAPLFAIAIGPEHRLLSAAVISATLTFLFAQAVLSAARDSRDLVVTSALTLPALVCTWISLSAPSATVFGLRAVFAAALLLYVTILLLIYVFKQRRVDYEVINAALCAYLTLGLGWASLYGLVELGFPGAFHVPDDGLGAFVEIGGEPGLAVRRIYFSFVTLLTLGYGDIYPVHSVARLLALVETFLGQAFLVVLIARLVGINVAQAEPSPPSAGEPGREDA